MTETLAEKACTPCRGGIPPLTHEEAERFRAQASDWDLRDDAHRSGPSGSGTFAKQGPLSKRSVNSPRPKAIIRTSASAGAMQR